MNRIMFSQPTGADGLDDAGVAAGVLITQFGQDGLPDNRFWVHRDEAEDTIRMIADAFDLDLSEVAQ